MAKLTPAQIQLWRAVLQDPVLWAAAHIRLPGEEEYFKPNYVQKKILSGETRKVVICVHRRAGKTYGLIIKALYNMFTRNRCQVLLIAPGEKQLDRFFLEFDDILTANPELAADVETSTKKPQFRRLKNGSFISGFIAKNGSEGLRGQSGDLVLIDEADFIAQGEWKVIDPIVRGDKYRKPPEMLAASTPNVDPKSRFLQMLHQDIGDDEAAMEYVKDVTPIFVPITENPDWTEEEVAAIRREYEPDRLSAFEQEYLCLPVSVNERQVFKKYQVEKAACLEPMIHSHAPEDMKKFHREGYARDLRFLPGRHEGEIRTVGVDWDRVQAGPSILMVSYVPGLPQLRVIYREEIDKNTPFLFDATCRRLIDIYKTVGFDHIFLEATRDVPQVEMLQLLARKECPDLVSKIEAIDYNTNHISLDLRTHEQIKRRLKGVIVGNLQTLFEEDRIAYPLLDRTLNQQLSNYTILGYTDRGARYSKENEHFIDALGLACWAIFRYYKNPFNSVVASKVISVSRKDTDDFREKTRRATLSGATDYGFTQRSRSAGWNRGSGNSGGMPLRSRI
jgi:hypothetical protein